MTELPTVLLKTEDLSLSYGRLLAVDQLNLTVQKGEVYGFLGRNGAGKTSTIRMLMGLIRPDAGRIEVLSFRGRRIGTRQKQQIGYVSQEQHFYPWMSCRSLGHFVSAFYPTWDQAEFDRLLHVFDLPARCKAGHLSGGMRVKLALALALAYRPPILILDEPTAGLDPVARREFLEIIGRQAQQENRTTFFSSHVIDEVERIADRVGILHKGQLCYEGDIETLQATVRRVDYVESEERTPGLPSPVDESQVHRDFVHKAEASGFTVLRDDLDESSSLTMRGEPACWAEAPFSPSSIQGLSLEDIFIALAGEAAPQL